MAGIIISRICKSLAFIPFKINRIAQKQWILKNMRKCGYDFIFDPNSTIITPQNIEIGNNVFIGELAHLSGVIKIGNNVMFGPRPLLFAGNHYFAIKGKSVRFLHPLGTENAEPIEIEDEVWCGASIIILGGVTVGMGAVVGAGSVVSKSIPPYTVAVGNPCLPILRIFDDDTLIEHLVLLGKPNEEAKNVAERRRDSLEDMGLGQLKAIDRTKTYWEFKETSQSTHLAPADQ